ncbi:hypothetical protein D3C85_1056170 [compost metagenome]
MLANLVQLATMFETGATGFHCDQADALGAGCRVGLAHDDDQVGGQAVADEGLAAVNHVFVAIAYGGGAHGLEVAAGAGFGHGDGQNDLARADARQPFLFLFFVAAAIDVRRNDVGVHAEVGATHAGTGELLVEHRAVTEVATATTVFGGQCDAEQAFTAGLEPGLAVDLAGFVPGCLARQAFTLEKTAHGSAKHFMVVAENGSGDMHARLLKNARPATGRALTQGADCTCDLRVTIGLRGLDERHPRWVAGEKCQQEEEHHGPCGSGLAREEAGTFNIDVD